MLFLTESEVRELAPMKDAIAAMRSAFADLASERAQNHLRRRLILPSRSVLHYMSGADRGYFGIKVYASNPSHGAHFLFLLYRGEDAAPLSLMEANHLGQIRTGAATGLATDLLASPDASVAAVIGSGFQARTQLDAVRSVRKIRQARVWSRSEKKTAAFAAECTEAFGLPVIAAADARNAVEGAAVVVTATSAREPVINAEWIQGRVHVNAIGSNQASRRELPSELILKASLIAVDSLEQARMESGDLLLALDPAEWERLPLVELQALVAGQASAQPAHGITIFKSNGLAVEDVALASLVYERAIECGAGRKIPVFEQSYS